MKTMTCKQLGGACDLEFHAETFEQMAMLSKNHGMEMLNQNDQVHMAAMEKMKNLMIDSDAISKWMEETKNVFDGLDQD